jgi:hypothetical protein
MNNFLYLTGQLIIFVLVIGLINALLYGIRYAGKQLGWSEKRQKRTSRYFIVGFSFWLILLLVLAQLDVFTVFEVFPPRVLYVFIPPLLFIAFFLFWPPLGKFLKAAPASWLIYVQSFRILMELFLWLGYRAGFVPLQMTFEWLNYDIIVGLTAPMAGFSFFGRRRYHRFQAILWNIFGMALLANIVLIAVLSMPSPIQVFMNEPSNSFIANIPFIWIPGFIVPFALAMHLFSLRQLIFDDRKPIRLFMGRKLNRNHSKTLD